MRPPSSSSQRATLALPCLFLFLFGLVALAVSPARAANFTIDTGPGLVFTPAKLTVSVGDTVTFTNSSQGFHDVHADDDSFRCANGCDGKGGDGSPSSNNWSFTLTMSTAGTVGYHCEIHGAPGSGMFGTITVNGPAAGKPGALAFTQAAASVAENAANVSIAVQRTGGSAGAVSVHYATSNGTGIAGTHYRATSGTLSWADGDAANKTFKVPVLDDGSDDGNHTVNIALSAPGGGATLGTAAEVLTVTNTDSNTVTTPAAPSNLTATAVDSTNIQLTWTLNSTNETGVRVQSKLLDGSAFQDLLPVLPPATNHLTVSGLPPATGFGFHVRAENSAGNSAYTSEVDAATASTGGPCVSGPSTLCLGANGRFQVNVNWLEPDGTKGVGSAIPLVTNPDSGLFYFFASSNIEMLIKVLNACAPPFNAYWVFFAATTNVQFTVTVIDTQSNQVRVYTNPQGQAALPVQDASAFLTCP